MITLLHASDLHFGPPHDPVVAEAFRAFAMELRPDVVVFSGDFTQRAKVREYEAARSYLDRFADFPTVVTTGNHDVPLYRVWERLFAPFRNYRRYISDKLDTVTRIPGATLVALSSAAPHRAIVNGRLRRDQLDFARSAFAETPTGDLRCLVTHHHLAPAPDYERDHPIPGGRRILDTLEEMGVELVLGGHIHRAFIGNSLDVYPGKNRDRGVVIVQSGTTTSRRGRAREAAKNSFNVVRVGAEELEVVHYLHFRDRDGFAPLSTHRFPRAPRLWLESPGVVGGSP